MSEVVLPTAGGCMRPWIWPNGKLHIELCTLEQLRIGDIAVWLSGAHLTAHRVVELGDGVVITQSDGSSTRDAPVRCGELLGRAVRFTKGPISYRLDGSVITTLSRAMRGPWSHLMAAARWGRSLVKSREGR